MSRTAGHPGYLALLDEMRTLHRKKAADYGRGVDPLANCRGSAEFGVPPWLGTMIRAMDKVQRIKSYVDHGTLANEGVEDSLKDLAAYALIALVLFREQHGTPPPPPDHIDPLAGQADEIKLARSSVRVYIAGPVSKGDLAVNINQATEAFKRLAAAGLSPFCPQWSCYATHCQANTDMPYAFAKATAAGLTHEQWLAVDLPWVEVADCVLRLPGESVGADREVAHAEAHGIPVFTDIEALIAWA